MNSFFENLDYSFNVILSKYDGKILNYQDSIYEWSSLFFEDGDNRRKVFKCSKKIYKNIEFFSKKTFLRNVLFKIYRSIISFTYYTNDLSKVPIKPSLDSVITREEVLFNNFPITSLFGASPMDNRVVAFLGLAAVALGTLYLVSRRKNDHSNQESITSTSKTDFPPLQDRRSTLPPEVVPQKPQVLFVVLPADIDLIYPLKQGSLLTDNDCETLYDKAESIWYGDVDESTPIINMINSGQFNAEEQSENDVFIVKFQLDKPIAGFERDSFTRYEAYSVLKDSLKRKPVVSPRLKGTSYGPLKMFYRH